MSAVAGDEAVTLTWTAPDLNGGTFRNYDIFYRHDNLGVSIRILDHSTTSKTITGLSNDVQYIFTIRTQNSVGIGLQSNAVIVTPVGLPSPIIDLRAVAGVGEILLTWTAPDLNGGTFVSYYIYDGGGDIIETINDHSTTSKTFAFPNVVPQSFSIRTETSSGLSSRSNTVTVTSLGLPLQITDLSAVAGVGEIALTWTAPDLNGGTFRNYDILYGDVIETVSDYSTNSKTITVSENVPYTFTIRTSTSAGIGLSSNAVTVTLRLPSQIIDLSAVAGDGKVDLTWTAPNLNGGIFHYYEVFSNDDVIRLTRDHSDTGITIPNLSNGENYTFTIRTVTSTGISLQSNAVTVTPGLPSRITDLSAVAGGGRSTLTWTAPNLNGGTFVNYDIFYDGTTISILRDYSDTSITFAGQDTSRSHAFTIRTQNSVGISLQSNEVIIPPTVPVTPLAPQCTSQVGGIVAFGNQIAGQTSDEQGLDISNIGNIPSNIFLKGTDWIDDTDRSVMDIGQTRYSGTESLDFQNKTQLSNSNVLFNDNLESGVTDIVYLQLSLDLLVTGFTGTATQTITVVTSCDP